MRRLIGTITKTIGPKNCDLTNLLEWDHWIGEHSRYCEAVYGRWLKSQLKPKRWWYVLCPRYWRWRKVMRKYFYSQKVIGEIVIEDEKSK